MRYVLALCVLCAGAGAFELDPRPRGPITVTVADGDKRLQRGVKAAVAEINKYLRPKIKILKAGGAFVVTKAPIEEEGTIAYFWADATVDGAVVSGGVVVRETIDPHNYTYIMLHELGHMVGLRHSTDETAVMWPVLIWSKRKLAPDDKAGIKALIARSN